MLAPVAAMALVLGVAGCGSESPPSSSKVDVGDAADAAAGSAATSSVETAGIDPKLTRDDVDCDAEALGEDDQTEFIDA
ncbi:MAG: hypothetical protein ACTHN0_01080 [Aquihabitans sp.]